MTNIIPQQLSIKELLSNGNRYIIPMYQRNYAWEEGEITQLIQDVIDYLPDKRNYYIGTLVVFKRPNASFEIIDGQQRLTTLSILAAYLAVKDDRVSWYTRSNLGFENREHSNATLSKIVEGKYLLKKPSEELKEEQKNHAILNGFKIIEDILPKILSEFDVTAQQFADYLFDKVQIMRVQVPEDTNLNHYFEIMNSRGEQLEKHEILKAKMLAILDKFSVASEKEQNKNCLHLVWEACANMEKYVQMGFTTEQRNAIFGTEDWGKFEIKDFDELREKLNSSVVGDSSLEGNKLSLTDIITKPLTDIITKKSEENSKDKDNEASERFKTVINFPNFLLHVLRIYCKQDIPLEDKKLIETFETHILNDADKVKEFIFALLKCKYLFDQHVIKREFIGGADRWSLKRLKKNNSAAYVNTFGNDEENSEDKNGNDNNRRILMLLSAFHVSAPTQVYKHWLNAALFHLYYADEIKAENYLAYLESVAKAFVFDRFLASESGADYFKIIYTNEGVCKTTSVNDNDLKKRLSFGNIQNNFVFNYLDYLLWLENDKKDKKDSKISAYEFTSRSSVEHYYPQNPKDGSTPPPNIDSFGNLCLISHSKNSSLGNYMPTAKKEHYSMNTIDSVKQCLMMDAKYTNWDEESINEHYEEMKEVLKNVLV